MYRLSIHLTSAVMQTAKRTIKKLGRRSSSSIGIFFFHSTQALWNQSGCALMLLQFRQKNLGQSFVPCAVKCRFQRRLTLSKASLFFWSSQATVWKAPMPASVQSVSHTLCHRPALDGEGDIQKLGTNRHTTTCNKDISLSWRLCQKTSVKVFSKLPISDTCFACPDKSDFWPDLHTPYAQSDTHQYLLLPDRVQGHLLHIENICYTESI